MSQALPLCHFPLYWFEGILPSGADSFLGYMNVRGHARIEGSVTSDKALDFARLDWSTNPADASPISRSKAIPQDPDDLTPGKFVYPIDERNLGRFVTLVMHQSSGVNANIRLELYARPDNGGLST